jgi:hypothetical protein
MEDTMPRTREITKHPALIVKDKPAPGVSRDIKNLQESALWDTMTEEQRTYLATLCWHKDRSKAAKAIGRSLAWVEEQEKDASFSSLIRETISQPKELAKSLLASMAPMAAMELMELILQNDNLTTKLNAIKKALDSNGIGNNDQGGFTGGFVNVEVKMFGKEDVQVIDVVKE